MRLRNLLFGVLGIFFAVLLSPSIVSAICEGPDYGAEAVAACAAVSVVGPIDDQEACKKVACYIQNGITSGGTSAKWYSPSSSQFAQKVFGAPDEEVFGERYTYAQVNWVINSLIAIANPFSQASSVGDVFEFFTALSELLTSTGPHSFEQYAKLGPAGYAMAAMEWFYVNPPASGVAHTKEVLSKTFSIAAPVHAQGVGFTKLGQGTLPMLWAASRNIAYLLVALLTIASGFLVMFRSKVNPQTIISVQMVIPRIVIVLILITFSYAIVGFVIDMIYVVITAFLGLIYTVSPNMFSSGFGFTQNVVQLTMAGNWQFIIRFLFFPIILALLMLALVVIVPVLLSLIPGVGLASSTLPILLAVFGIVAWSLYVTARILGQLLLAYLNLSLLTISGPLQILTDVLPNNKTGGFTKWITCVIGNASVFVSYAILAFIASALFGFDRLLSFGIGALVPDGINHSATNLIPGFTLPGIGNFFLGFAAFGTTSITGVIIGMLTAMGFFTAVPNIVAGIRDAFCKTEDNSKFIEGILKETLGSITKTGQSLGESMAKSRATASSTLAGGSPTTGTTAIPTAAPPPSTP